MPVRARMEVPPPNRLCHPAWQNVFIVVCPTFCIRPPWERGWKPEEDEEKDEEDEDVLLPSSLLLARGFAGRVAKKKYCPGEGTDDAEHKFK
ncbi:hypothetical protein V1477_015374 [Vespula maculifrons]|uniref:Uncharacterized protein n=2 Tax=Vespula TaxID=7451 RepID=A0A834JD51_VESVU|nr:hypothetical protein HZH66_012751 [Vespula vulgaris]